MKTRKLGWTPLNLSTIGLGTFALGGSGWAFSWGPQNDNDSIATILRALDMGVNWIDTAPVYGVGHAEEIVGKAIRGLSNKPIIATKCGLVWDRNLSIYGCLNKKSVRSEIEASLKRLQIDVIDLMQIHWPNPDKDIEEAWSTIAELVKEGKIRYAGVSNFDVGQLKRAQAIHPVASLQPPYSMLQRGIEDEILAYCDEHNIGVIVYSPMQQGLLTGKFSKERLQNLPVEDHRRRDPHFQEPELSINLELINKLYPLAQRSGHTLARLAIAWVLRRPEVSAAIVGARVPSQIKETISAADWMLSEVDISAIERLLQERSKKLGLY